MSGCFFSETQCIYKFGPKKLVWCKQYFDNLNRLGVTHECEGQTDRWTDRQTFS